MFFDETRNSLVQCFSWHAVLRTFWFRVFFLVVYEVEARAVPLFGPVGSFTRLIL